MLNLSKDAKVKIIIQIQLVFPFQITHVYNYFWNIDWTISYSVILFSCLLKYINKDIHMYGVTFYLAGALGWLRTQVVYHHYTQLLSHSELMHIHRWSQGIQHVHCSDLITCLKYRNYTLEYSVKLQTMPFAMLLKGFVKKRMHVMINFFWSWIRRVKVMTSSWVKISSNLL